MGHAIPHPLIHLNRLRLPPYLRHHLHLPQPMHSKAITVDKVPPPITTLSHSPSLSVSSPLVLRYPTLKVHKDTQLCIVAVGIIGDISCALGDQSTQYAALAFLKL
ncbi:hypothetical protein EDD22DRAFT_958221 [Suillus occidentalis]|nr:hypothetical protein EDD22DRAFT_958221 [Suillus occidentalis]